MKIATLLLALALPLAACEGVSEETTLRPAEYVCAAATGLLNTASDLDDAGKLSDSAKASVTQAVAVLNPTCASDAPPTLSNAARVAMEQALSTLTATVASAQK